MELRNRLSLKAKPPYSFLSLLVFAFFVGAIYSKGLSGIFLLDDFSNIAPALMTHFSWDGLYNATVSNTSGILKRPVSAFSFAITSLLHGDQAWAFKYHNILIHLLSGVLIYFLTIKIYKLTNDDKQLNAMKLAALVSCLWLVHPLHVSTVLYSVQRMTQLSSLFTILALIFYLKGYESEHLTKKIIHYFLYFPICLLLSIFSKENGVLIPAFIILLSLLRHNDKKTKKNKADNIFLIIFGYLPIILGCIIFYIKRDRFLDYSSRSFDLYERLLSQINFVFLYIQQLLLPRLSKMGLYFDDISIPSYLSAILALKLLTLTLTIIAGLFLLKRNKIAGFGVLFFFTGHLLESTIIPLELAFEHRNYLPSVGLLIAFSSLLLSYIKSKKILFFTIATLLLLFSSLLFIRVGFWADSTNWQKTTLSFHPNSERTRLNYIFDLQKTNNTELAIQQIIESQKALPEKLSFKLMYLAATCNISNEEPDNIDIIDDIYNLLNNNNVTTIGFNTLATLTHSVITPSGCTSISPLQVENFIDTVLLKRNQSKYSLDGNLYFLKALLRMKFNSSFEASEYFRKGFEISHDPRFKFNEAKALISNPKTRTEGLKVMSLIKSQHFFNTRTHIKTIAEIDHQVSSGKFRFSY